MVTAAVKEMDNKLSIWMHSKYTQIHLIFISSVNPTANCIYQLNGKGKQKLNGSYTQQFIIRKRQKIISVIF